MNGYFRGTAAAAGVTHLKQMFYQWLWEMYQDIAWSRRSINSGVGYGSVTNSGCCSIISVSCGLGRSRSRNLESLNLLMVLSGEACGQWPQVPSQEASACTATRRSLNATLQSLVWLPVLM